MRKITKQKKLGKRLLRKSSVQSSGNINDKVSRLSKTTPAEGHPAEGHADETP